MTKTIIVTAHVDVAVDENKFIERYGVVKDMGILLGELVVESEIE